MRCRIHRTLCPFSLPANDPMRAMNDRELQAVVALEGHHAFPVLLNYIAEVTRADTALCVNEDNDTKLRQAQGRAQFGTNLQKKIAEARQVLTDRAQHLQQLTTKPGGPPA